jgi:hypothetical protein
MTTDAGTTSTKLCWWMPWAIKTHQIANAHTWTDDMISRNYVCKCFNYELKYHDEDFTKCAKKLKFYLRTAQYIYKLKFKTVNF